MVSAVMSLTKGNWLSRPTVAARAVLPVPAGPSSIQVSKGFLSLVLTCGNSKTQLVFWVGHVLEEGQDECWKCASHNAACVTAWGDKGPYITWSKEDKQQGSTNKQCFGSTKAATLDREMFLQSDSVSGAGMASGTYLLNKVAAGVLQMSELFTTVDDAIEAVLLQGLCHCTKGRLDL